MLDKSRKNERKRRTFKLNGAIPQTLKGGEVDKEGITSTSKGINDKKEDRKDDEVRLVIVDGSIEKCEDERWRLTKEM